MGTCKHGRSTNIQLAEGVNLTFNSQAYNKLGAPSNGLGWIHQLIIGATGTGKSRSFVRPNIYSLPTDPLTGRAISMVITDPKGELLNDTGAFLKYHGYEIKVFNLERMECSDCYNPFAYIHSEEDVAALVDVLVVNMGGGKDKGDHWIANATAVLKSICYYIYYEVPYVDANFANVLHYLNMWGSSEEDDFESEYDKLINDLEAQKGPGHSAVIWRRSVSAKGQELGSIISTASTICSIFNQSSLQTLTKTDSMELDKLGDRPTALYVISSPTTSCFNFLIATLYSQLFLTLQNKANKTYKNQGMTLPHKVWFLLDEFANTGKIPAFDEKITLIRSAGMFCSIIVQAPSQITAVYDKTAPTIMSNCSVTLFLGAPGNTAKDDSAADFISQNLGKKTIQAEQTSVNFEKDNEKRFSYSYSATERPLMTPDEVKRLPGDECIILLGGQKPIIAKKLSKLEECMNYDIYKKIGNYNVEEEKNTQKTYYEGRLKSEAIQAVLEADKRIEHARRLGIKEVDLKFEQGDLTKEVRATSSIPAETTFAGKTVEDIKPEIKVYNWREEFDDPEKIENEE